MKKARKKLPVKTRSETAALKKIKSLESRLRKLRREKLILEGLRRKRIGGAKFRGDLHILAMGIAHEFNNILGAVDGHAEWALDSQRPEDWRESLEIIRQACERSAEITSGLRSWGQPKEELKGLYSLRAIFRELEKMVMPVLEASNFSLLVKSADFQIYVNRTEILEVLLNIVHNSIDALLSVANSGEPGKITIDVRKSSSSCAIRIADNGPGIPEVYRDKIFEPFFTLKGVFGNISSSGGDGTQTALKGGSGLGLFLSRSIIEEHGGRLELEAVEKGTVFLLHLPLTEESRILKV